MRAINIMTTPLWKRIFNVDSSVRDLCLCAAFSYTKPTLHPKPLDGIGDFLKRVIFSPDILNRGSSSHMLLKLLTEA